MDGDTASQTSKESPDVAEGRQQGFLGEDEGVVLKKNPTLQTLGNTIKEKVQQKSKKGREKTRRATTWATSVSPKIGPDNVIISKEYLANLQQKLDHF